MKLLRKLLDAVVNFFMEKQGEQYADIPALAVTDINEQHAQAILEDRQRTANRKLMESKKHLLAGYKTPVPFEADRIDVHFERQGIIPPTDLKRNPRPVQTKTERRTARN